LSESRKNKCAQCGNELPFDFKGNCPKCGHNVHALTIIVSEQLQVKEDVAYQTIREFYEKNPAAKWTVISITVLSSVVGLVITGVSGILAGLALGILSYLLGPKAVTKVREIRRG
jgi:hypothetical protein